MANYLRFLSWVFKQQEMAQREDNTLKPHQKHDGFKSYTQMLATLPQHKPLEPIEALDDWTRDQRKIVKICDAYCQLIVGEHNVSACATGFAGANGEDLRVAVSLSPSPSGTDNEDALSSSILERLCQWRFIITSNPERTVETPIPIFAIPTPPKNMTTGSSPFKYAESLEKRWEELSISNHIWLVSEMLGRAQFEKRDPSDVSVKLGRYSIVASRGRIIRRFKKGASFLDSLASIDIGGLKNSAVPPPVHVTEEHTPDHYVLRLLRSQKPGADRDPSKEVKVPVPCTITHDPETTSQFHILLVELLKQYSEGLGYIDSVIEANNGASIEPTLDSVYFAACSLWRIQESTFFEQHLRHIDSELIDLSKLGLALEGEEKQDSQGAEVDGEVDRDGVEEGMRQMRQVPSSAYLGKPYANWITMSVNTIGAANLLARFATSDRKTFENISVITLTTPHPKRHLLDWETTILSTSKGDTGLPVGQSDAREIVRKLHIVNDVILSANQASQIVRDFQQKWEKSDFSKAEANGARTGYNNKKPVVPQHKLPVLFPDLPTHDEPDAHLQAISERVTVNTKWGDLRTALQSSPPAPPLSQTKIDEINLKFAEVKQHLEVFTAGDFRVVSNICNLSSSKGFTGTVHCEMSLSTILPHYSKRISPELPFHLEIQQAVQGLNFSLEGFGQEIGVSKRCCPVCYSFLREMMASVNAGVAKVDQFRVAGCHTMFSSCALPPWTPEPVIDRMIDRYAGVLNQTLTDFLEKFGQFDRKGRRDSTTSATVSDLGSENDYPQNDQVKVFPLILRRFREELQSLKVHGSGSTRH